MKILHTADWHIGKRLYHYDLHLDFALFSEWLIGFIEREGVDLLLVSGDVFDLANPSSAARHQYYSLLVQLSGLQCKVIVTGGNHDSPAVMNAPKEVLNAIDIHVVGSLPEKLEDCVIPVINKQGACEVVVHAVPFLRDADLRNAMDGVSYDSRKRVIQEGIEKVFAELSAYGHLHYPHIPQVAMGHLFTAGVSSSDSEREIQLGNEAKFEASRFNNGFDYMALGHIHKPQRVNAEMPIYYAGSPIPLSFSEREDNKRVLLIDTTLGFEPKSIAVPQFRKLIRVSGSVDEIEMKLQGLSFSSQLKSLIEVELIEEVYGADIEDRFLQLVNDFKHDNAEIVKTHMHFKDKVLGAHELFDTSKDITDLKPMDMFSKLLETQTYDEEDELALKEAFRVLVEQVESDVE